MLEALELDRGVAAARARVAEVSRATRATASRSPRARATRRPARSASASTARGPLSVVLGTSGVVFAAPDAYGADPAGARPRVLPRGARALARDGRDALRRRARCAGCATRWRPGRTSATLRRRGGGLGAGRRGPDVPALPGRRAHAARRPRRARRVHRACRCATTAARSCAAVLEGVAYGLRDSLDLIARARRRAGESAASRAAARAASCGCRSSPPCSSCRSSASPSRRAPPTAPRCSAAIAGGVWADAEEAVSACVRPRGRVEPVDPHGSSPTAEGRERFRALYPALQFRGRRRSTLHFVKPWRSDLENRPCGGPLRRHRAGDRQHAARRAQAPLAQAGRPHLGQARVPQPDGVGQGPRRARPDRGRRGEGG